MHYKYQSLQLPLLYIIKYKALKKSINSSFKEIKWGGSGQKGQVVE